MVYVRRSADLPLSVKIKVPYQRRPFEEENNEWDEYEETAEHHIRIMEVVFSATFRRWRDVELHLGMEDLAMLNNVAYPWDLERDGPLELLESATFGIEEHLFLDREKLPYVFRRKHAPRLSDIDFVDRALV
ncbi:hypothetical protein BDZ89DRAFT_1131500 [Hymenopellis radicata]|nr:hypothetical protein BDZ89DRAFT_1131500 [Hymenopellis radicata]